MINKYENLRVNKIGGINAFINGNETTLTESEVEKVKSLSIEVLPYIDPVKTLVDIRTERDSLLVKKVDIYNPLRWAELTAAQKDSVKKYRQALLDITKQDPSSVIWPEPPSI